MMYTVEYYEGPRYAEVNMGPCYTAACAMARRVSASLDGPVDVCFRPVTRDCLVGLARYRNGKRIVTDGPMKITSGMFKAATGRDPINDDLERCNCEKAGTAGHMSCGWNDHADLPRFMSSKGEAA